MNIVGVDWGNYQTTIVTPTRIETYPSDLLFNRMLKVTNSTRKYDFLFKFKDKKGIAGTLAQDEKNELDRNRRGDTKNHEDALIRLLIGLHQFADSPIKVVVGQPINRHYEKQTIKELVIGNHEITVNGQTKIIQIQDAAVGVEGGCCLMKKRGLNHLIDVGSGTINFATVKNGRFISSQSDTIPKGIENLGHDYDTIAQNIRYVTIDLGWKQKPYLTGGGALLLKDYLDYPIHYPTLRHETHSPEVANAIALYEIGERLWR